ncbi:relaxase/mobilization nuclease domain-containing protein [Dyadobacter sp. CY261]|uniref:relaxase/mobilization nuclease domain-containing protein n=1 Tax=Dyadobacter sp. CY261 TaxID=2907203 RepID=UPI001F416116|nr:relaxase/mobilization nuclease domain-containing protein [Dyadobacter sp. CY261]MCF0075347.1 relaxase/mobilization nuclease domain-containing protein [Dyadobacter sp. CY261]
MIGKASLGNYAKGLIEYCYYDKHVSAKMRQQLDEQDVRGELVYIQNLGIKMQANGKLDLNYLINQFTSNHMQNTNLKKFMWHQSFSFAPGEKPGNETIAEISTEFAKEFGFEQNQMLVFKHEDSANLHFHIVANRINSNGKNTSKHFHNYARTGDFCRRMEQRLELVQAPEMRINKRPGPENVLTDKQHLKLKSSIDQALNNETSIDELKAKLLTQGYKTYIGRGIAFYNMRKNIKIKGSDLGRSYSLAAIEKRLAQNIGIQVKEQLQHEQKRQKKQGLGI